MTPKVPSRPLPGELAGLDSITTLHFRKVAVPSSNDSIPKVYPEMPFMAGQLSPESMWEGDEGVEGLQGILQGSRTQTKQNLQVSGVHSLSLAQNMLDNSGYDSLSMLTGSSTIPAWNAHQTATAAPPSFNKYSKVISCYTGPCKQTEHNHVQAVTTTPSIVGCSSFVAVPFQHCSTLDSVHCPIWIDNMTHSDTTRFTCRMSITCHYTTCPL